MSIALAATWNPRGEVTRFYRFLHLFQHAYAAITIVLPSDVPPAYAGELEDSSKARIVVSPDWSWGRYSAIQTALEAQVGFIHYADMDRLLRWVETRPEEWHQTLERICQSDYLVIGRTQIAYATHPQALIQTEAISNLVTAHLVGQPMDVSAGSKGFSRRAAEFIIANTHPGHALGTDAEWTVLMKRAGFEIGYLEVDGLDWESADRYLEQAADAQSQMQAAKVYDSESANWARRVEVAHEIVRAGLEASQRKLCQPKADY
jgi:hypothetical protein